MKKQWKNINSELREKILAETKEAGCVIAEVAKKYGIRKERVYRWRGQYLKSAVSSEVAINNFIEAKIESSDENNEANNMLKKVSLEFEGFSLSIEGSIKLSKMQQIIEILC